MRIFSTPVVQQKHNNNLILNILVHDQMRITIRHNTNDMILVPHSPSVGSSLYRRGYMTLHLAVNICQRNRNRRLPPKFGLSLLS